MKRIILSALFVCSAVFAGSDLQKLKKDFVEIPVNPDFTFARDLQGNPNRGKKSPIAEPYLMAKYPVTNAEYADFCKETGHRTPRYWRDGNFPKGKAKHPVLEVSVDDINAYCRYMEKKYPSFRFRLPTEAEWENAAAGPKHYAFPWGDSDCVEMKKGLISSPFNFNAAAAAYYLQKSPDLKVTFFHQKSSRQGQSVPLRELISVNGHGHVRGWINHADYTGFVYTDLFRKLAETGGFTTAVDRYPEGKSYYGCFDMAGNAWEWTSSKIVATRGAERGKTVNAIRGGSWYANKDSCRTYYRGEGRQARGCYNTVGFRLVAAGIPQKVFITVSVIDGKRESDTYRAKMQSRQQEWNSVSGQPKTKTSRAETDYESEQPRTRNRKGHSRLKQIGPDHLH